MTRKLYTKIYPISFPQFMTYREKNLRLLKLRRMNTAGSGMSNY